MEEREHISRQGVLEVSNLSVLLQFKAAACDQLGGLLAAKYSHSAKSISRKSHSDATSAGRREKRDQNRWL